MFLYFSFKEGGSKSFEDKIAGDLDVTFMFLSRAFKTPYGEFYLDVSKIEVIDIKDLKEKIEKNLLLSAS